MFYSFYGTFFACEISLSLPLTGLFFFFTYSSVFVRTMVYLFNITTDVLSYAYQLLFYITFLFSLLQHSTILSVLLFWDMFPSPSPIDK